MSVGCLHSQQRDTVFIDGLNFHNLVQLSGITNAQGRQLDLIFANTIAAMDCGPVQRASLPLVPEDAFHPAIELYLPIAMFPVHRTSRTTTPRALNFTTEIRGIRLPQV
uniref:Uncharacterized protein n=1 Tax=Anopheles farauti TaxID=69004 RepID=A0A182Q058_9DIPT